MSILSIKEKLMNHLVTSVDLVKESIKLHEKWIDKNAIAQISPFALSEAMTCDQELKDGKIRGPLHGIPILIKDNILYRDGTPTTANAFSLHDLIPPYDAFIVWKLKESGAIILGKANLSEFAYFMSYEDMPSGYGSMYGQVKHPFNEAIDPLGSSTGSAVAVKLGIVDISIGTETNGSLMAPAYQCQIVSFKPSFGYVSKHGIIPISPTQDTAGPMAQTVYDCALLMDVIAKEDPHDLTTLSLNRPKSFTEDLNTPLERSRIGMVYMKNHSYNEDDIKVIETTKKRLKDLGHEVIDYEIDDLVLPNDETLLIEFKYALNQFLSEVKGSTRMSSLKDIISFNKENEQRCLRYGQSILIASEKSSGDLNDKEYLFKREKLLKKAYLFESMMIEHHLIALVAPVWLGFAPIYGNPSIVIPEGIYHKTPKSMVFVGKKYDDHTLLRLAHQYHIHE